MIEIIMFIIPKTTVRCCVETAIVVKTIFYFFKGTFTKKSFFRFWL